MPDPFGPEEFAALSGVSRETLARLKLYVAALTDANARHNLVSRNSLAEVWQRHVWDSAQLAVLIPEKAKKLIDLGSGAGFPGLVLAAMRPDLKVSLCESIGKKCQFLAEAAAAMRIEVDIRRGRIEEMPREGFDVVSARALASLKELCAYASRFQQKETVNLFLKSQNIEGELKDATKYWRMEVQTYASRSHPAGLVLEIRKLIHVQAGGQIV